MHASRARGRTLAAWTTALALPLVALAALAATEPGKPAKATPLTDANIVAIVEVANDGDIKNGMLAEKNGGDAGVKDFGKMMVTDHTSANEKTKALAAKLGLKPAQDATSRGLVKSANAKHAELSKLSDGAFDHAYMDAEVTMHQAVLDLLDQKLIPGAKNAELRTS